MRFLARVAVVLLLWSRLRIFFCRQLCRNWFLRFYLLGYRLGFLDPCPLLSWLLHFLLLRLLLFLGRNLGYCRSSLLCRSGFRFLILDFLGCSLLRLLVAFLCSRLFWLLLCSRLFSFCRECLLLLLYRLLLFCLGLYLLSLGSLVLAWTASFRLFRSIESIELSLFIQDSIYQILFLHLLESLHFKFLCKRTELVDIHFPKVKNLVHKQYLKMVIINCELPGIWENHF